MEEFVLFQNKQKGKNIILILFFIFIILQITVIIAISLIQFFLLRSVFSNLSDDFSSFSLNDNIKEDIVNLIKFLCNTTKACSP